MNLRMSVTRKGSMDEWSKRARANTRGRTLDRALATGALPAVNAAKRRAPYLSGNLRRSIHIGGFNDLTPEARGIVQRGQPVPQPEGTPTRRSVYWGTDVEYARAQEFGYPEGNIPAKPYIRPAHDETRSEVVSEVAAALRDLVKAGG